VTTWVIVLLLGVLLVALELLARGGSVRVAEPSWGHDLITPRKVDQLRALGRGGVTTLFIGASPAFFGVDPDVVDAHVGAGHTSYNGAVHRGVPPVTERWLRDWALPIVRPQRVVLCISGLEMNDNDRFGPMRLADYERALRSRSKTIRRRLSRLTRHLVVLRYLELLARRHGLASLRRLLSPPRPRFHYTAEFQGLLGPRGQGTEMEGRSYWNGPKLVATLARDVVSDFAACGQQMAVIRRMAEATRASGAEFRVALCPVYEPDVGLLDSAEAVAYQRCVARDFARLGESENIEVVDLRDSVLDQSGFADLAHMNAEGRRLFSVALGEWLADAAVPSGSADRRTVT
jgi:hypothetical protein